MRVLIAPDSFKESLKASEVARIIANVYRKVFPGSECIELPMADGGEGTVDALVNALGGEIIETDVKDPLMRDHKGFFGQIEKGNTAVIEMAAASGLELLEKEERNPWITSTYGTGQLIRQALDKGCEKIIVGIGGSATNDSGAGMAQALGIKLLDKNGKEIGPGGGELSKVEKIDKRDLDQRLKDIQVFIASDVQNPLCGKEGASHVYGPQKGASADMVEKLDNNLYHFGKLMETTFNIEIIDRPGSGAAGGLGAGLIAFLNAEIKPGFDLIAELTNLNEKIKVSDLVITGEGKLDEQTKFGKTPYGVANLAKKSGIPVIAFAGTLGQDYTELYEQGFDAIFSIVDRPMEINDALKNAADLLEKTGYAAFKLLKIGTNH